MGRLGSPAGLGAAAMPGSLVGGVGRERWRARCQPVRRWCARARLLPVCVCLCWHGLTTSSSHVAERQTRAREPPQPSSIAAAPRVESEALSLPRWAVGQPVLLHHSDHLLGEVAVHFERIHARVEFADPLPSADPALRRVHHGDEPIKVRRGALHHGVAVAAHRQRRYVLAALVEPLRLRLHQPRDEACAQLLDPDRHGRRRIGPQLIIVQQVLHPSWAWHSAYLA
eukprot:CAMPEP_0179868516 /NCGR_PEP_ID=MMETSP0982-20121206/18904_1 /TAXON_ID=483367 /ORGANISM="non described non described, Strain CCMP 2436" /LENGTH=226 /DNA_ID=CAMNT_0021758265 /DNA_START=15 /DNA_END=693 /DNA_ORIENTATION=-